MAKWIVQAYVPSNSRLDHTWKDIRDPDRFEPGYAVSAWEAEDAGGAFNLAVLQNRAVRIESTAYRVLPFDGGVTLNVGVNVDAVEHAFTSE